MMSCRNQGPERVGPGGREKKIRRNIFEAYSNSFSVYLIRNKNAKIAFILRNFAYVMYRILLFFS